jgi:hypothetical protein
LIISGIGVYERVAVSGQLTDVTSCRRPARHSTGSIATNDRSKDSHDLRPEEKRERESPRGWVETDEDDVHISILRQGKAIQPLPNAQPDILSCLDGTPS